MYRNVYVKELPINKDFNCRIFTVKKELSLGFLKPIHLKSNIKTNLRIDILPNLRHNLGIP